jgi:hypothetical protein
MEKDKKLEKNIEQRSLQNRVPGILLMEINPFFEALLRKLIALTSCVERWPR